MDLRQLKHFLAVYEKRHYGRAAAQLGLSQSALTKSIAKLESSLKLKLFERGRYGASPTPYGESLAHRARIILSEEKLAILELDDIRLAGRGVVRMGMGFSCAHTIAPQAIARMNASHPGVTIVVHEGVSVELIELLLQGELDFVISSPPASLQEDPELVAERLFRGRDVVVAAKSHPLFEKREVRMEELADTPWCVSHKYTEMVRHIQKIFISEGIPGPRVSVRTDSTSLMLSLILRAGHLALLSEEFLASSDHVREIGGIRSTAFDRARTGYLFYRRRSRMHAAAARLAEHVKEVCIANFGRI